jgi:hypothetical protein
MDADGSGKLPRIPREELPHWQDMTIVTPLTRPPAFDGYPQVPEDVPAAGRRLRPPVSRVAESH